MRQPTRSHGLSPFCGWGWSVGPGGGPQLLCQQIGWHYEDLDPHCDKERRDKTSERQQAGWDGIGDRITSLTLRRGCWLFMRETKDHSNSFAV